ncbi:MAG: class I adenylate-forming enzyme family protein [Dichotomicrobium sp.]
MTGVSVTASTDLHVGRIGRYMAQTNGERIALDDGAMRLTYAELDRQVDSVATALGKLGVGHGDVVCAYLPNCIEYVLTVLAVARAGGIFSPLNPRFRSGELTPILEQARPKVVIVDAERLPALRTTLYDLGQDSRVVVCGGTAAPEQVCWADLLDEPPVTFPPGDETEHFSLLFTSGTTGIPKGALATHRARMLWVLHGCILYGLSENDVYVGTMPLVHSAGLSFTLMHLYVGGRIHIMPGFSAEAYLDLVEGRRVTSSLVVPTMLTMILDRLRQENRPRDLSSLERLVTCGSPLQEATKSEVLECITPQLYDYYGSTESNSMTVLKPEDQRRKPKSVGQPFVNVEIRIADEAGNTLPPLAQGEVCCRNPSLMSGYLDNPEATAGAFFDGWFRTGDIGYLDEEGYLYLVGRRGDIIISGGMNIYPAEVENALTSHPEVLDCAVTAAPHPKWGQCVAAFVVPRDGGEIDLETLQAHCTRLLADFKKPRILKLVDSIPKNAGGKTVKSQLPQLT